MNTIAQSPAQVVDDSKRFATLRAAMALAGWALHSMKDDEGVTVYMAMRWAGSRTLRSLNDVESFCRQVGVKL